MYLYRFLFFPLAALALLSHKLFALCNDEVAVPLNIRATDFGPGIFASSLDLLDGKIYYYRCLGEHRISEILEDEGSIWSDEGVFTRYVQRLASSLGEFLYFETGSFPSNDYRCFLKFKHDVQWRSCARTLFVLFLQRTSQLVSINLDVTNDQVIDLTDEPQQAEEGDGTMYRTIVPRETTFIQDVSQGEYVFWSFDAADCDMCMDVTLTGNAHHRQRFVLELSIKSGTTAAISTRKFEKVEGSWRPLKEPVQEDHAAMSPGYAAVTVDEASGQPSILYALVNGAEGNANEDAFQFTLQTLDIANLAGLRRAFDVFFDFVPGPSTTIVDIRARPGNGINKLVDGGRELWSSDTNSSHRVITVSKGEDKLVTIRLYDITGDASVHLRKNGEGWRRVGRREYKIVENRMAKIMNLDISDYLEATFEGVQHDGVYKKHQLVPADHCLFSAIRHGDYVLWKYEEYVLDICTSLVIFGTRAHPFLIGAFATFDGKSKYIVYRPGATSGTWVETRNVESYWPVITARGSPLLGNLPTRINDIGNRNLINFTAIAIPAQARRDRPIRLDLENLEFITGTKLVKSTYEGGARGTFVFAYPPHAITSVIEGRLVLWEADGDARGASYIYLVEAGNYKMLQVTTTLWGNRELSRFARKSPNGWEWIRRCEFVSDLRLWKKRVDLDIHDPGENVYMDVDREEDGNYEIVIIPPEDVFVERILDCGQPIWEYRDYAAQVVQGLVITGTFTSLEVEITVLDKNGNSEFLTSKKIGLDWAVSYPIGDGTHLLLDINPTFSAYVATAQAT